METTVVYFSVRVLSAIYILYKVWMLIFSRKAYEVWESLYHRMRIARVRLWKYRKKRMEKKARNARRKAILAKGLPTKQAPEVVEEQQPVVQETDVEDMDIEPIEKKVEILQPKVDEDDVIGKTNIVYLEDPEVARKTPDRSEPLEKVAVEVDEEINPDDVDDGFTPQKRLSKADMEELMALEDTMPDPDFSNALTFEQLSNVADVLMAKTDDRSRIMSAAETLYSLQDTDLFKFFSTEISTQNRVEKLIRERLDSIGKAATEPKKQTSIDWNKFM